MELNNEVIKDIKEAINAQRGELNDDIQFLPYYDRIMTLLEEGVKHRPLDRDVVVIAKMRFTQLKERTLKVKQNIEIVDALVSKYERKP